MIRYFYINHEEQQRIRDNISLAVTAEHYTADVVHIEATAAREYNRCQHG